MFSVSPIRTVDTIFKKILLDEVTFRRTITVEGERDLIFFQGI